MSEQPSNAALPTSRKRIENVYVTVDACADLGGQPYAVLESLQKIYKITGRRTLCYVDTEQGFHEKSDCTIPAFLSMLEKQPSNYAGFIKRNPEWTQIVSTSNCRKFRADLAQKIIPWIVHPLMKAADEISQEIRQEAFDLMKQRGQHELCGKAINSPRDIDIRVDISDGYNPVFREDVINYAADRVMPLWKEKMNYIEALNAQNTKKHHKGFMAEMVKAMQEVKAFSYAFTKAYSSQKLGEIKNLPELKEGMSTSISQLSNASHLFADTQLPDDSKWWEMSESIQALRLTKLWPWSLKNKLSEQAKTDLDTTHKNTADMSYLTLFTNTLPELSEPASTLFIIVTHDGPLIKQFLECSSGVLQSQTKPSVKQRENGAKKSDNFVLSPIYEQFHLTKRQPEEYPHQAAWVGSEFVEFSYKEILAAMSPYITAEERHNLSDKIRENKPGTNSCAHTALKEILVKTTDIADDLRYALTKTIEETYKLESFVRSDIEGHGAATKEGRYHYRKEALLKKREELRSAEIVSSNRR